MLFMGSSKYPDENAYDSYVSSHGGSCNAMTEGMYICVFVHGLVFLFLILSC